MSPLQPLAGAGAESLVLTLAPTLAQVPDLASEPAQLHQLRLAAARASSSPSARLPCQLPRALFPADPDAVPTFASAEVARGFVAA